MIAENNYRYEEPNPDVIEGWYKVCITQITSKEYTKAGNATGFWIKIDVWDDGKVLERLVWLSFNHPSEFVIRKSNNIGAMLRMMFPAATNDSHYIGRSFWLLFETYKDKQTGKLKESFFNSKHCVSTDGKTTLYGNPINVNDVDTENDTSPPVEHVKPDNDDTDDQIPYF